MNVLKERTRRSLMSFMLALAMAVTITPAALMLNVSEAAAATMPNIARTVNGITIWDCVYFGSYPQTEVVDKASTSGVYGRKWAKASDYVADASLYSQLKKAKYDGNGDTIIGGNKYRRISKSDASFSYSGDSNYFNWADAPVYRYFRYDKIKWRVIEKENGYAMLLADKTIDDKAYNTDYADEITWERCSIRSWLNGYDSSCNDSEEDYTTKNFINTAFSASEQNAIQSVTIDNHNNIYYETNGGNDTSDKVFLLSESDVWNTEKAVSHGFVYDFDTYAKQRRAQSTTYAKAMGTHSDTHKDYLGNCWWWLRSPGGYSSLAAYVDSEGYVSRIGSIVYDDESSVRPALYIKLTSSSWSDAGTASSESNIEVFKAEISSTSYMYNGEAKKPKVTITGLAEGTDYKVTYSNHRYVGKARAKATGIGSYTGVIYKYYKIIPKGTEITSLSAASKAFTVTWKKQSIQTTGYQLRCSTNSKMTDAKVYKIEPNATVTKKVSSLSANKKYYVQLRTYKRVDGVRYFSSWSKVKAVTTK